MNLTIAPGATGSQLISVGAYQPSRVVTNADLSAMLDTSDEWIRSRVGIAERRIADADETVVDMAVKAARAALGDIDGADIDAVIVACATAERRMPSTAAAVAGVIGSSGAAFDLNAACAGFSYALASADQAIRAGAARKALVIGAEKMSTWMDWQDRSTAVIFADGAGAVLVAAADKPGIGPVVWGSDGSKADLITLTDVVHQEGQSVYRWATTAIAPVALAACEAAGVKPDELAAFVPHQANARIIDAITRRLGITDAVVAKDIETSGNTSAASIPIALSALVKAGRVPAGAPVLLAGFGAGLSFASQVVLAPGEPGRNTEGSTNGNV